MITDPLNELGERLLACMGTNRDRPGSAAVERVDGIIANLRRQIADGEVELEEVQDVQTLTELAEVTTRIRAKLEGEGEGI